MASGLFRLCASWIIGLVLALGSFPAAAQSVAPADLPLDEHVFRFYLDPALVPDMAFAREVLPKYVADLNTILAKNTRQRLAFDPSSGILLTSTKPQTDSAAPPLPTEGFEIWAHAVLTTNSVSFGGYAGLDSTGAGVLAGLHWTRLYDPDQLTSAEVLDYTVQIDHMLHELAHVFGAGVGEYYSLSFVSDVTDTAPLRNINLNDAADPYWADKSDFMFDPLLRYTRASSRPQYLQAVRYSDLTAAVLNGAYRNGIDSFDQFTVRVLDADGMPVPAADVEVWSVVARSTYDSALIYDQPTDSNGQVTLPWGGTLPPHNAANLLRLIKVYKDGIPLASPRYVSIFDSDIAMLVKGQPAFLVTIAPTIRTEVFTSLPRKDGWVRETSAGSGVGAIADQAASTARVGNDVSGRRYRSILAFNTSRLPDNAVVTGVQLKIREKTLVGGNPFATLGQLSAGLSEPFIGADSSLRRKDFQAAVDLSSAGVFDPAPVDGWYSAQFSSAVDSVINPAGGTQFRLEFADAQSSGADYLSFYSGNAAVLNRPVLTIEYYVP